MGEGRTTGVNASRTGIVGVCADITTHAIGGALQLAYTRNAEP